jgi:hypothetical protein
VAWLEETYDVVNPNCPEGAAAYQSGGMKWFYEQAEKCDVCVFLPLPDGCVGSGVAAGVKKFFPRMAPVFRIDTTDTNSDGLMLTRVMDLGLVLNSALTREATIRYSQRENGGRK